MSISKKKKKKKKKKQQNKTIQKGFTLVFGIKWYHVSDNKIQ